MERVEYGLFYGNVTMGAHHYANAVLTADGILRIHIANAWDDALREGSAQFVGQVEFIEYEGSGSGIVIGQECVVSYSERLCQNPLSADIRIATATRSLLAGEIRVVAGDELESWPFELTRSDYVSLRLESLEGSYEEGQAEFAVDDNVVVSIDDAGRLFFQGPHSGCVGNGVITQDVARGAAVFDATVDIANCRGELASLNASYEGLGVHIPSDFYYDAELILWLSTRGGATTSAALTMWSYGL